MWENVDRIIQRIGSRIDFDSKKQIDMTQNIVLKKLKTVHLNIPSL